MSVKFEIIFITTKVETKHRIAWNLARIAQKFSRSTKIEIEILEKKLLDFCLDRKKIENFMLEIAWIENSKSKFVLEITRIENFNARNGRDRCFCRSVSTLESSEGGHRILLISATWLTLNQISLVYCSQMAEPQIVFDAFQYLYHLLYMIYLRLQKI